MTGIRTVRLVVPYAGDVLKQRVGAVYSRVNWTLRDRNLRSVSNTAPLESFSLTGDAVTELSILQTSLHISDNGQLETRDGLLFNRAEAQRCLRLISKRYGDVPGAFSVTGGIWVP